MTCFEFKQQLDNFLNATLSTEQQAFYQAHVRNCAICQTVLTEHQNYLAAIATFNSEHLNPAYKAELSPEKAMRMLGKASGRIVETTKNNNGEKVQLQNKVDTKTSKNSGFIKGFLAASVMFIGFNSLWQLNSLGVGSDTSSSLSKTMPSTVITKPQDNEFSTEITLLINVPEDMLDADLQLRIPDNIVIEGYEGEELISWYVDLKKGANSLSLPIRVSAETDLNDIVKFVAEIEYQDKFKEFELEVNLLTKANQVNSTANVAESHKPV